MRVFGALCALSGLHVAAGALGLDTNGGAAGTGHRALFVEAEYIAIGVPGCDCEALHATVKLTSQTSFGVSSVGKGTKEIALPRHCLVRFEGNEATRAAVLDLDDVRAVEPNYVLSVQGAPPSWGLDRIDQNSTSLDGAEFEPEYDGTGTTIYVLDTGINYEHEEFRGRVSHHSIIDELPLSDGQGHGTHCAGTAAGSSHGVARGAHVWGIKVLDRFGSGSVADIAEGVGKAIELQAGLPGGVLSMSLGGPRSQALDDAVEDAAEAGLIVVVAAGNNNIDACRMSPAAMGGNGRHGGVISVGATALSHGIGGGQAFYDTRAPFSNYGLCVDIWAPGVDITSAWTGSSTATHTISGTSMATPHVAGVAALMLERNGMNREAAVRDLFALATQSKVTTNAGAHDPTVARNRFLQLNGEVHTPSSPTPQPTTPPTPAPAGLYVGTSRFDFAPSKFGPQLVDLPGERISGQAKLVTDEPMMCAETAEDLTGKIAVVLRGACAFHDKVVRAQRAGAVAVIIAQTREETLFPPIVGSGGTDMTTVPSCMVPVGALFALQVAGDAVVTLGVPLDEQLAPEEEEEEEEDSGADDMAFRRLAGLRGEQQLASDI